MKKTLMLWKKRVLSRTIKVLMLAEASGNMVKGGDMSQMHAMEAANFFVWKSNEKTENDLTNLKLQKILYFAQGTYLGRNGAEEPLFPEPVEAWKFGPVVREVYNSFATCGSSPITLLDVPSEPPVFDNDIESFLEEIWAEYGKYSASYLVDKTHQQAPWVDNYDPSRKNTIPVQDMTAYFSSL